MSWPAEPAATLAARVPVDLGRDEARRLARRELADPRYDAQPDLVERVIAWVLRRIGDLLETSAGVSPGSWAGLAVLAGLLALAAVLVRRRTGPMARARRTGRQVFDQPPRSSDDHRRSADAAAAEGRWDEAVIERFRAVVRSLEERAVLDPRPARTADEAAREAAAVLTEATQVLRRAAAVFDGVRYGGRPGTAGDDDVVRAADLAVRRRGGRSTVAVAPTTAGPKVPR